MSNQVGLGLFLVVCVGFCWLWLVGVCGFLLCVYLVLVIGVCWLCCFFLVWFVDVCVFGGFVCWGFLVFFLVCCLGFCF